MKITIYRSADKISATYGLNPTDKRYLRDTYGRRVCNRETITLNHYSNDEEDFVFPGLVDIVKGLLITTDAEVLKDLSFIFINPVTSEEVPVLNLDLSVNP